MSQKTVLLVDDEPAFLEALEDALVSVGIRVLKARDVTTALDILAREKIDLITIDVMLSPGAKLQNQVDAQQAGVYLCERVSHEYPHLPAFCLSVVNNEGTIRRIQDFGVRFLRKGETPLRTVLGIIQGKLKGVGFDAR